MKKRISKHKEFIFNFQKIYIYRNNQFYTHTPHTYIHTYITSLDVSKFDFVIYAHPKNNERMLDGKKKIRDSRIL